MKTTVRVANFLMAELREITTYLQICSVKDLIEFQSQNNLLTTDHLDNFKGIQGCSTRGVPPV